MLVIKQVGKEKRSLYTYLQRSGLNTGHPIFVDLPSEHEDNLISTTTVCWSI